MCRICVEYVVYVWRGPSVDGGDQNLLGGLREPDYFYGPKLFGPGGGGQNLF